MAALKLLPSTTVFRFPRTSPSDGNVPLISVLIFLSPVEVSPTSKLRSPDSTYSGGRARAQQSILEGEPLNFHTSLRREGSCSDVPLDMQGIEDVGAGTDLKVQVIRRRLKPTVEVGDCHRWPITYLHFGLTASDCHGYAGDFRPQRRYYGANLALDLFNVESSFGRLGQPHRDRRAHRLQPRNVQAPRRVDPISTGRLQWTRSSD